MAERIIYVVVSIVEEQEVTVQDSFPTEAQAEAFCEFMRGGEAESDIVWDIMTSVFHDN
jgi:hypothetical protein